MTYRPPPELSKAHQSRQKSNHTQSLWYDDKIPPLISINAGREKQNDKISIDSLNQSEVRSIYTVDKEDIDRNTLDILNKSFKSQKNEKNQRVIKPATVEHPMNGNNFQTPILKKNLDISMKEEIKTPIIQLQEINEIQYKNCHAVRLYRTLVQQPLRQKIGDGDSFDFEWLSSKNPAQLLANVLTNHSRLRLYIHYLLKEIHNNDQARYINQIHQQNIKFCDPQLKEAYTNIVCLLSKIINRVDVKEGQAKSENLLQVSIFENGLNIDIDPKCSLVKKRNNEKIRQLRHEITEKQSSLRQIKKLYEEIIQNYTETIGNMSKSPQSNNTNNIQIPLKQSRVHLEIEEDQMDVIRKKNHTFGMKQLSNRSSRQ